MITFETLNSPKDERIVKLVFESMNCPFTSSRIYDDLTIEEVRDEILKNNTVTAIKDGDKIVGIMNPNEVTNDLYFKLSLNSHINYQRMGIIYIADEERGKGYAGKALEKFIKENEATLYITHQDNEQSNAVAKKHMKFKQEYKNPFNFKMYNVYVAYGK